MLSLLLGVMLASAAADVAPAEPPVSADVEALDELEEYEEDEGYDEGFEEELMPPRPAPATPRSPEAEALQAALPPAVLVGVMLFGADAATVVIQLLGAVVSVLWLLGPLSFVAKVVAMPAATALAAWALAAKVGRRRVPIIPLLAASYGPQLIGGLASLLPLPLIVLGYVIGVAGYLTAIVVGALVGCLVCSAGTSTASTSSILGTYVGFIVGYVVGAIWLVVNIVGAAIVTVVLHGAARVISNIVSAVLTHVVVMREGRPLQPGEKTYNQDWLTVPPPPSKPAEAGGDVDEVEDAEEAAPAGEPAVPSPVAPPGATPPPSPTLEPAPAEVF